MGRGASRGTIFGIVIGLAGSGRAVRLRIGHWASGTGKALTPADPTLHRITHCKPRHLSGHALAEFAQVGDFAEDAARALARYPELLVGRVVEMKDGTKPRLLRVRVDVDPYDTSLIAPG